MRTGLGAVSAAVLVIGASAASGASVTLTMVNGNGGGGEFNTTAFGISHDAPAGVSLTQMTFTVGDTQYLFDQLYLSEEQFVGGNGTQTASLLIGDRSDDGAGQDTFRYGFTNLTAGIVFRGQWDIDNDNGDFNADMRQVFFNNGAAPNAVATFAFSDGSSIVYTFPDLAVQSSYSIVIPGPGAAAMGVLGVLALFRRRR